MIILEGKAAKPSYLHIKDGKYEILDAKDIWGKTTSQTQEYLKKQHGAKTRMICIGPAAEKMVRHYLHFTTSQVTALHHKYSPMDKLYDEGAKAS